MPADLAARILALVAQMDAMEKQIGALERSHEDVGGHLKEVRHDFGSMRSVANMLMDELEERVPRAPNGRKGGKPSG